jgi:MHS family proline/betaine transporter-like MFS transporter
MRDDGPAAGKIDQASRGSLLIGALGTTVEWYDFSVFVYLAPTLSRVFFPEEHGLDGLIATFAVFAVAYLGRPIGAIVFGSFGDRRGRRSSLTVSAAVMAVTLALTGLLPGWSTIGVAAPVALFVFRLAMAFAVGGEYSGILIFLTESGPQERRGLTASLAPATSGLGALIAVGLSAALTAGLDQHELDTWGWRIAFFFGALLAAAVLISRRMLSETPEFRRIQARGQLNARPVRSVLQRAPMSVVAAFVLSAVGSVSYYLCLTYVPTYLNEVVHLSDSTALWWSTVATVALVLTTPLFGMVADRYGTRVSLSLTAVCYAIAVIPLFRLLSVGTVTAFLATIGLALVAGAWSAMAASAIPEIFQASQRFSGLAIGYNLAVAIFGGTTPLLATLLVRWTDVRWSPALLLTAVSLLALPFVGFAARRAALVA